MEGVGGAAAHMPVARVVNLTKAIESLKERGYYSVGLDGGGDALVGETGFETIRWWLCSARKATA